MLRKFSLRELGVQVGVCAVLLLLTPGIVYFFTSNLWDALVIVRYTSPVLVPCFLLFFINYYLLLPKFFFRRGHRIWFYAANLAMILLSRIDFILDVLNGKVPGDIPMQAWLAFSVFSFINMLFYVGSISLAWGVLHSRRTRALQEKLAEEQARRTEAELTWLKNQINPHFLFNTLNNISSLVAIDADRAQDSIATLSELLRYAMYESERPTVALSREVEFMQNYISMMNLRCSGMTEVSTVFDISSPSMPIAPLLLISLIENAYKHGLSSNKASFIRLRVVESGGVLTFECANSNFPKGSNDRSGSGIGLTNVHRRLDLLYPGRYTWTRSVTDEVFKIGITIRLCEK